MSFLINQKQHEINTFTFLSTDPSYQIDSIKNRIKNQGDMMSVATFFVIIIIVIAVVIQRNAINSMVSAIKLPKRKSLGLPDENL